MKLFLLGYLWLTFWLNILCCLCFFLLQEACPPKLTQMAYVTAGTYYEEEILQMELIILKVIQVMPHLMIFIKMQWQLFNVLMIVLSIYYAGIRLESLSRDCLVLADALLPVGINEQKVWPAGAAVSSWCLCTNDTCKCSAFTFFFKHTQWRKGQSWVLIPKSRGVCACL